MSQTTGFSIHLKNHAHVIVTKDKIVTTDAAEHTFSGGVLKIVGEGGGSGATMVNNFSSFGGSSYSVGSINGLSMYGNTIHYNGLKFTISGKKVAFTGTAPTGITINGRTIDLGGGNVAPDEPIKLVDFAIPAGMQLSKVHVEGSGDVTIEEGALPPSATLALSVQGSGDIHCNLAAVNRLSASVTGSGDISGDGTRVETLKMTVTGSGDIKNFRGTKSVTATVTGSGDIRGDAEKSAQVDKNCTGTGSVKIHRV